MMKATPMGSCALCDNYCNSNNADYANKEIEEARRLRLTMKNPYSQSIHILCLVKLRAWLKVKRIIDDRTPS